jgi:hypothetical protein
VLHEKILESPKINTDDTAIPIKSRKRKGSTYKGYLWVYIDDRNNVVFDYSPSRSREGPLKFLGGYGGYVQADAYGGYDELFRRGKAIEVGCNSHASRKLEYSMNAERTLRTVVVGRKNYMFAGSEAGAWRAAIIYSLVASCKLNDLDPFVYFNDVLRRVSTHPANKIDELHPSNWQPPVKDTHKQAKSETAA